MKLTISEPNEFDISVDGDVDLCSCVAQTVFYFSGLADWKIYDINKKTIKKLPEDLKEKLDNSKLAYHKWTELEEKILIDNIKTLGADGIIEKDLLPGIVEKKILSKARLMKLI